jgi:hypothetical protein
MILWADQNLILIIMQFSLSPPSSLLLVPSVPFTTLF